MDGRGAGFDGGGGRRLWGLLAVGSGVRTILGGSDTMTGAVAWDRAQTMAQTPPL